MPINKEKDLFVFVTRSASFAAFLILSSFIVSSILRYFVPHIDYREKVYRLKWDNLKAQKYDILFLGSSKVYHGINPVIIDSIIGKRSYNMATPLQTLKESLFILRFLDQREILPKTVVIDLYWNALNQNVGSINTWYNLKRYSFSDRLGYELNDNEWELFINNFIPLLIYNKSISVKDFFVSRKLLNGDFSNWQTTGFYSSFAQYVPGNQIVSKNITAITAINSKYLSRILEFGKEHNLNLVFTVTPVPLSEFRYINNYDTYINKLKEAIYPCELYDFNNREEYSGNYLFFDYLHLNNSGSRILSTELSSVLINYN
jgi:hypothetical protein